MNQPQGPTPNPHDFTRFIPVDRPIVPEPHGPFPPASWPQMPPSPPPHGSRRLAWILLGLVCVLTITAVALTVTLIDRGGHETARTPTATPKPARTSTSATPDGHAPLQASVLDLLLPDRGVVSSAVAAPAIDLVAHGEYIDAEDLVDADCQGVVSVSSRVYVGSGWTAIRWQHWNNPPETNQPGLLNHVALSVTTFPQADTARAFFSKQSVAWQKCAGHIVNGHLASAKDFAGQIWIIGEVTASGGVLATTAVSATGADWSCRTTLSVRNNVAVRTAACGHTDPAPGAQTILRSITQKIDAAG